MIDVANSLMPRNIVNRKNEDVNLSQNDNCGTEKVGTFWNGYWFP